METTDNHTPTPEELTLCIEESAVRATDTYEQSPTVLRVDGSVIGTLGNFSASIGKAKSKKTFNVAALTAAALTNGTVATLPRLLPRGEAGHPLHRHRAGTPPLPAGAATHPAAGGAARGAESRQPGDADAAQIHTRHAADHSRTGHRHHPPPRSGDYRRHPRPAL